MNRLFEIQTLSDRNYKRLADPVTVITGILTVLPSLFPGLTGAERLTMNQLNTLFPGNGHYTTQYKSWLLQRVKYTKDLERDLHMYTGKFIENNLGVFCPNWSPGQSGDQCWSGFYGILKQESYGGGIQPPPGIDYSKFLLYGGAAVLLLVLLNKKKTRKK